MTDPTKLADALDADAKNQAAIGHRLLAERLRQAAAALRALSAPLECSECGALTEPASPTGLDDAKRDCLAAVNDAIQLRDDAIRERDEARAQAAAERAAANEWLIQPHDARSLAEGRRQTDE